MVFHILNDEKFSDWVIDAFEEVSSGKNVFLLISESKVANHLNDDRVRILNREEFLRDVKPERNDLFIFYFLHLHSIDFLNKYKNVEYKKAWIGYGADYYYYLLREPYFPSLYKSKTLEISKDLYRRNFLRRNLLRWYQSIFFRFRVKKAIRQLNYFAPVLPNEFDLVQSSFNFGELDFLNFTFGDVDYLSLGDAPGDLGCKILVNNSATLAGNHVDILALIDQVGIFNGVIVPLSYGNDFYRKRVIDYVNSNLKFPVELLTDFIPREDYFKKVRECGFVIMGHIRQQAMGNIYGALILGAKLFLYKQNPVFKFLTDLGVIVFRVEEIIGNPQTLNTPLTREQRALNRQKIYAYYSKESSLERVRKISAL